MTIKTSYLFAIAILAFSLINCSPEQIKDKIEEEFDVTNGTDFTAEVNGKEFGASKEFVATYVTITDNVYAFGIVAGDVEGLSLGKAIALAFTGEDYSDLKAGTTWNSTESDFPASAGYEEDSTNSDDDYETEITESIYIKITAIDKVNLTISGEFNFVALDEDTNKRYSITDGKFTKIPFQKNE